MAERTSGSRRGGKAAESSDPAAEEQRLGQLFDECPLPMWIYDAETLAFLAVNNAAVAHYGYRREEFLAMSIKDIRPEKDIPVLLAEIEALPPGNLNRGKWVHRFKGGRLIEVEIVSHGLHYLGRPARFVIAYDLTERKQELLRRQEIEQDLRNAIQELERKERSKSRFLAATAHDLRQPLYAAQLFVDALAATPVSRQQLTSIKNIQEALKAMSQQLQLLLDMSRMDDADIAVKTAKVSTMDLFEQLANTYDRIAARNNVHLLFHPGNFTLVTDKNLLSRLIGNLIDNAIKFSSGGRVLVCARRGKGGYVIQVRDNGMGIADAHHKAIFDDFYQIGNVERDPMAGFGLGLAIVSRIARLLGIEVALDSAPGKGSTFSVVIAK